MNCKISCGFEGKRGYKCSTAPKARPTFSLDRVRAQVMAPLLPYELCVAGVGGSWLVVVGKVCVGGFFL